MSLLRPGSICSSHQPRVPRAGDHDGLSVLLKVSCAVLLLGCGGPAVGHGMAWWRSESPASPRPGSVPPRPPWFICTVRTAALALPTSRAPRKAPGGASCPLSSTAIRGQQWVPGRGDLTACHVAKVRLIAAVTETTESAAFLVDTWSFLRKAVHTQLRKQPISAGTPTLCCVTPVHFQDRGGQRDGCGGRKLGRLSAPSGIFSSCEPPGARRTGELQVGCCFVSHQPVLGG